MERDIGNQLIALGNVDYVVFLRRESPPELCNVDSVRYIHLFFFVLKKRCSSVDF